jgi:intracellular sulfur oxidation DsrE/DsrF family protein
MDTQPVHVEGWLMATVFVLNNAQMGHGDRELGEKILGACLRKLLNFPDLEALVLYNSGVRLATKDSPLAPDLHQLNELNEEGVDVFVCGTCVEHFGLGDRLIVDRVSNMDEILATLARADKVVTL